MKNIFKLETILNHYARVSMQAWNNSCIAPCYESHSKIAKTSLNGYISFLDDLILSDLATSKTNKWSISDIIYNWVCSSIHNLLFIHINKSTSNLQKYILIMLKGIVHQYVFRVVEDHAYSWNMTKIVLLIISVLYKCSIYKIDTWSCYRHKTI